MNFRRFFRAVVVVVFCIPGGHFAWAETHKLESSDGKTIEAEIVAVTDSHARIHVGKKAMKVDLAKFSEKSREYLIEWQKKNISYSFDIEKTPKMVERLGGAGDVHTYGYEINVESRVAVPLKELKVRYRIYNTAAEMKSGEFDIDHLTERGEKSFITVAGSRTKYKRLWRWDNRWDDAGSIGNHLGGIWVRIYDKQGKMVHEWQDLGSSVRNPEWKLEE